MLIITLFDVALYSISGCLLVILLTIFFKFMNSLD